MLVSRLWSGFLTMKLRMGACAKGCLFEKIYYLLFWLAVRAAEGLRELRLRWGDFDLEIDRFIC